MLKLLVLMLIPVLVAVYTFSFGLYNWRQGNKSGAVGVYCLALGSVGVPLLVMLFKQ